MITLSQKQTFDSFWVKFSKQVSEGNSYADITPSSEEILTLVSRLPIRITNPLHEISKKLDLDFSGIYVYPPQTIHTTVLFMTNYVKNEVADNFTIEQIKKVICNSFTSPINAHVCGLGLFPTTVFAQIYMEGMEELRRSISEGLKEMKTEKTEKYEGSLNWSLSFANIARFKEAVNPDIVQAIEQYRNIDFGSFELREIELDKTDKFLSEGGTANYGVFRV